MHDLVRAAPGSVFGRAGDTNRQRIRSAAPIISLKGSKVLNSIVSSDQPEEQDKYPDIALSSCFDRFILPICYLLNSLIIKIWLYKKITLPLPSILKNPGLKI